MLQRTPRILTHMLYVRLMRPRRIGFTLPSPALSTAVQEGGCHVHHASSTPAPVAATPYRHLSGTPVPFNPHGPSPRPQGLVHSPPGLSRQSAPAGLLPLHTPAPQHAATPIAIHRSASFTPFHSHQLLGGAAAAAATPQQQQQYVDESQQLRDAASSAAAEPISFTQELGAEATAATDGSQPSVAETSTSQPQPPRYCRNCTLPTASAACDSCGHLNSNKAAGLVAPTTRASLVHDASSSVMIAYDERMQLHAEDGWGRPHPERPDRVAAVMTQLSGKGVLRRCRLIPCREITDAELAGVHDAELVKEIARQAQRCGGG